MGINIVREEILLKGLANKNSIKRFIPCGPTKATQIFNAIQLEAAKEGKSTEFGFDPKRLLQYVHMTKHEVSVNADIERKLMKHNKGEEINNEKGT
ncbi:MAG: hypothetical protein ACRCSG_02805 [Cellulosilyticaceae bacterium]